MYQITFSIIYDFISNISFRELRVFAKLESLSKQYCAVHVVASRKNVLIGIFFPQYSNLIFPFNSSFRGNTSRRLVIILFITAFSHSRCRFN